MRYWLWLWVFLLVGCSRPMFGPVLLSQCGEQMLTPGMGGVPRVGGAVNPPGKSARWHGRILLVQTPRAPGELVKVHPAQTLVDDSLQAHNDAEVATVGYVLELSRPAQGGAAGRGYLELVLMDWKSKVKLGTWTVKEWTKSAPVKADFEGAYPTLVKKLKDFHAKS